jgi:outer membrane receptor protein involved in Fe transport
MGVDVTSSNPLNSGSQWDGIASPKATLAFRASDTVELYADIGRGFHSNDARGAVTHVAPVTGDPLDPVSLFVPALGAEIGARFERGGLSASLALWGLELDSELVYSGDAGDTESSNASRRFGAEALLNWTPVRSVNIDLSAAATHARYEDTELGADRIPNALRYVITGGVSVALTPKSSAELTVRRLGPAPLIEDGSVMSGSSTLTNLLYRYNFSRVSLFAEVLNVFDRSDNDITYFYASRLPGEPVEGVEDVHFHPMEPRTFRVGLKYTL